MRNFSRRNRESFVRKHLVSLHADNATIAFNGVYLKILFAFPWETYAIIVSYAYFATGIEKVHRYFNDFLISKMCVVRDIGGGVSPCINGNFCYNLLEFVSLILFNISSRIIFMTKETLKKISIKVELRTRPPIVVVMGHVDHGKTACWIISARRTCRREAGGITQATAAYEIEHLVTARVPALLQGSAQDHVHTTRPDTKRSPHAFARRAGGRLAILVIAADEGVKPKQRSDQIIEDAKTPFIVATIKVDKTGGNLDKARNDSDAAGVLLGLCGQVSYVPFPAKTGEGVSDLWI